jgi:hypothetical protein
MAKIERSLNNNNPVLKINLAETLGVDTVSDTVASGIGQAIIDKIKSRTQDENEDKNGRNFKPYSKDYIESIEFKAFGKSPKDVNLTASGDMLGLMDIVGFDGRVLEIGWNDPEQAAKAHGHITGKNGEVPKMKRDFFGIKVQELEEIASQFKESETPTQNLLEADLIEQILKSLTKTNNLKSLIQNNDD